MAPKSCISGIMVWPIDCYLSQHYSSESKLKRGCNAPDRKKLRPDEGLAIDREAHFLTEVFMEASDWPLVMQKPLDERLLLLFLPWFPWRLLLLELHLYK